MNRISLLAVVYAAATAMAFASAPATASTKTEQTFGAWKVTCVENNGKKQCQLGQVRTAGPKKQVAFVWSVHPNASKQLMNSLIVPANVSVKEGFRVSIGSKPVVTVPYDNCMGGRCVATLPMDAATLQAMSTSPTASSNYVLANRKLQQVQVDLKEFPKAYEYFKSQLTSQ